MNENQGDFIEVFIFAPSARSVCERRGRLFLLSAKMRVGWQSGSGGTFVCEGVRERVRAGGQEYLTASSSSRSHHKRQVSRRMRMCRYILLPIRR